MDDIYIHHGQETHAFIEKYKCKTCIEVEEWFEAELKKAGGLEKLIENMRNELHR